MKTLIYLAVFWQVLNCSAYTPTVNGHVYVVEDRFGGGYTDRLDIFMNNYDQAIQFGRQWIKCKIKTPE